MAVKGSDTPALGTDDLEGTTMDDLETLFAQEMEDEGEDVGDEGDEGAPEGSDADDDTSDDEALEDEDAEEDEEQDEDSEEDSEEDDSEEDDFIEDDESPKKSESPEDLYDKLIPVKDGDFEGTVTVGEARLGYMRMQNYTRKTTEVAELRKEVEAQKQVYGATVQQLQEHLKVLTGEDRKPDPALRDTDPGEYAAQMADYNALVEYRRNLEAEQKRLQAEAFERQKKAFEEARSAAHQQLLEKLPSWKDDKVREREQRALVKFMKSRGYENEEIASLIDPRAIIVIREALLYSQQKAKAKDKTVAKKGAGKTKPTPSLTPKGNVRPVKGTKKGNAARALKNVRFGSSVDDLAAALMHDPDL